MLKRRLGLHQYFDFLFNGFDLERVVVEQGLVLLGDKGVGLLLGLGLDDRQVVDELFEPERQFLDFTCRRRHGDGGFGMEELAIIGQRRRVAGVSFGPFSLGLAGGERMRGIEHGDEDFSLVAGCDHGPLIAAGGFTDHMRPGQFGQFSGQLSVACGVVWELELMAVEMHLERRLGDIHADINRSGIWFYVFHSREWSVAGQRDRTQPYAYELAAGAAAQATVRVWSTGSARLMLGYGQAGGRPRVERARAPRRDPLRRDPSFCTLPEQGNQKTRRNTAIKQHRFSDPKRRLRGVVLRRWSGCSTRLATLAFVPQPDQRRMPEGMQH